MHCIHVTLWDDVVEKTQLKTQLLRTYLFETNRSKLCIANQLTGFYAILNIDKNRLN